MLVPERKFLALFLFYTVNAFVIPSVFRVGVAFAEAERPILILGDSMTKGDFGRDLHQIISEETGRETYSIGIGGVGSWDYTRARLINNCCGYSIRRTLPHGRTETLENSEALDNRIIGKNFGGNLEGILNALKPSVILIALGTNRKNAHVALIELIRKQLPETQIIWIGPPILSTSAAIYAGLTVSLSHLTPPVPLIRCDQMKDMGDPKVTMLHYSGKQARDFATEVYAEIQKLQ